MRFSSMILLTLSAFLSASDQLDNQFTATFKIKEGDLIFRSGKGSEALAVTLVSGHAMTHVGIISEASASGVLKIIHAEPQADGNGFVKEVYLSDFTNQSVANKFEVWRPLYKNRKMLDKTLAYAKLAANQHTPFDKNFAMSTPSALYCSELIVRSLNSANFKWSDYPVGSRIPFMTEAIILPSELLRLKEIRLVFR